MFRVAGLKILGRVSTHIFDNYFLSGKNIILCNLKGIAFQNAYNCIFYRKPEQIILVSPVNLGRVGLL